MNILKKIFELIFIFIIPFVICCFSFHKVIENEYDLENNLINVDTGYEWSVPFNDFKNDNHYINYLYYNQFARFTGSQDYSKVNDYTIILNGSYYFKNVLLIDNLNLSHIYLIWVDYSYFINSSDAWIYFASAFNSNVSLSDNNDKYFIGVPVNETGYIRVVNYNENYNFNDYEFKCNIIDLTLMFGAGYEPNSLQKFNLYVNNFNVFTEEQEIIFYSHDINISKNWNYNYTIWGYLFNNILVDSLKINDCFSSRFISSYVVFVIFMIFVYHLIMYPLCLIFKIIFFKD